MGYYATYGGSIRFRSPLDEQAKREIEELAKDLWIEIWNDQSASNNPLIGISGDEKYHDEDWIEFLTAVSRHPIVEGEIDFKGEDGYLWRYAFRDGHWFEDSGHVEYTNSNYPLQLQTQSQT